MSKKKLILHIGQSKTGTSSIQKFCQSHRQSLFDEEIFYPSVKKNGIDVNLREHNSFAETLCGISRYPNVSFEDACRQFDERFMSFPGDKMLLSGESFWGLPHVWGLKNADDFLPLYRQKLLKLKNWTSQYHLHVILYLRHPLDWFQSSVSHIIRHEGLLGKKVYRSDEQLYELLKPHMDYLSQINLWREVLSPDVFTIRPFDRTVLKDGDAVADFCSLIGYQGERLREIEENSSWPAEVTEFKKKFNETPHTKWKEWTAISVLSSIADNYPSLSAYQIDEVLQGRIISEMGQMCGELSSEYGVKFPVMQVKFCRDIRQDILANVDKEFTEGLASWSIRLKTFAYFMKGMLRNYLTGVYNLVKFLVSPRKRISLF